MKKLQKWLGRAGARRTISRRWPHPSFDVPDEPHFLFILTPPCSGSTALAQILNTADGTALLHAKAEGQWLIPGMCESDRWNPKKEIDWESVRAVWLRRIQRIRESVDLALIIEKSPPNIVRVDQLTEAFPDHSLMAFNRDPYANCSSILYRYHDPKNKTAEERIRLVSSLAEKWLLRSGWIRKWIEERQVVNFSYEEFCSDPSGCVLKLAQIIPVLRTVDVGRKIKVKDYKRQGVVNLNPSQLSRLRPKEIEVITKALTQDLELVSFFGYGLLESGEIDSEAASELR